MVFRDAKRHVRYEHDVVCGEMGAEDVVGVSVAGAKCEVFMLRHGSGIFCQEVLIVVPHGLREHYDGIVWVASDDIEAEILEYSPQIAEIASACEQYGYIGGEGGVVESPHRVLMQAFAGVVFEEVVDALPNEYIADVVVVWRIGQNAFRADEGEQALAANAA